MAYGTQSTTLASTTAGTASTAVTLDPNAKVTSFLYSLSATGSTGSVSIQVSLDDMSAPGAATQTWGSISSALISTAVDTAGGVVAATLQPITGARMMVVTGLTSTVTATLKVRQSPYA